MARCTVYAAPLSEAARLCARAIVRGQVQIHAYCFAECASADSAMLTGVENCWRIELADRLLAAVP